MKMKVEAKKVAAREKTTVRALVEDGLRKTLAERNKRAKPFKLKLITFRGNGLGPGVDPSLPRHLAYDPGSMRDPRGART